MVRIESLFDREPPHALDMEVCLVGSIVLDPRVIDQVAALVPDGSMFYGVNYGDLYDVVLRIYRKHGAVDRMLLLQACRDANGQGGKGLFDRLGCEGGILHLCEAVPTAVNAPVYARVVRDKHLLRRAIEVAGSVLHAAFHTPALIDGGDVEELLARWARWFSDLHACGQVRDASVKDQGELAAAVGRRVGQLPGSGVGVSGQLERLRAMSGAKKAK